MRGGYEAVERAARAYDETFDEYEAMLSDLFAMIEEAYDAYGVRGGPLTQTFDDMKKLLGVENLYRADELIRDEHNESLNDIRRTGKDHPRFRMLQK